VSPAPASGSGLWLPLGGDVSTLSTPLQIVVFLTVLSFVPALLMSMTSFTRFIIVFNLLRQGLGTQTMPPNPVLIGLSLFLTLFVMAPVVDRVQNEAVTPVLEKKIDAQEAYHRALVPFREFMQKHTREKDIGIFMRAAGAERPTAFEDVPTRVLVPAFMVSELETAFRMGFILFLPFLVIDMVVATVLLSMGTFQMPPVVVSLPLKILLFVLVDGWGLVVGSLLQSFR
jgi:flagellar biosynthesis protein FliP